MTEQELAAIEALANAATPGPWESDGYDAVEATGPHGRVSVLEMPKDWCQGSEETGSYSIATGSGADLAYAAAMHPPTTLALIAEIRRLRREMALNVALSNGQSESLIEAAFEAGYNKGKLGVGEFWPAARQTLQTLKRDESYRDYR